MAVSTATATVIQSAGPAYQAANALHETRVDYDAVAEFDDTAKAYNPRHIQPLISDHGIEVRLAVLAAFQTYVQSVVDITNGTDSPQLDASAKSAGSSLNSLATSVDPELETTTSVAASTGLTVTSTVNPAVRNGISTAANALGQFLVSKKIKKELPGIIKNMDPHVQDLCILFENDIDVLQDQETRDYNSIINRQTSFVADNKLDPEVRREQIMKLPHIVRQEQQSSKQLAALKTALEKLALTHHALAAEAQGNNPKSWSSKLSDLEATGSELGAYYSSLPTQ